MEQYVSKDTYYSERFKQAALDFEDDEKSSSSDGEYQRKQTSQEPTTTPTPGSGSAQNAISSTPKYVEKLSNPKHNETSNPPQHKTKPKTHRVSSQQSQPAKQAADQQPSSIRASDTKTQAKKKNYGSDSEPTAKHLQALPALKYQNHIRVSQDQGSSALTSKIFQMLHEYEFIVLESVDQQIPFALGLIQSVATKFRKLYRINIPGTIQLKQPKSKDSKNQQIKSREVAVLRVQLSLRPLEKKHMGYQQYARPKGVYAEKNLDKKH